MIRNSNKVAPKLLLRHVENDVRSVTGSNIRQLLLENSKTNLSDIEFKGSVLNPVPEGDVWRIGLAFDSIDILNNVKFVPDFDKANVKQMLNDICISWYCNNVNIKTLKFYFPINDDDDIYLIATKKNDN